MVCFFSGIKKRTNVFPEDNMGLLGFENILLYLTKHAITLGLCYNNIVALEKPLTLFHHL